MELSHPQGTQVPWGGVRVSGEDLSTWSGQGVRTVADSSVLALGVPGERSLAPQARRGLDGQGQPGGPGRPGKAPQEEVFE